MSIIVSLVIVLLAYPLFAAWLMNRSLRQDLDDVREELKDLRANVASRLVKPSDAPAPNPPPRPAAPPTPLQPAATAARKADAGANAGIKSTTSKPGGAPRPRAAPTMQEHVLPPAPSGPPPRWLLLLKDWLFTGNLVAKLGLAILFIGIAFLVKVVGSTFEIPIAVRLAAVVAADVALLGWGWRLRTTRRDIGLPVQGTAIAILMLVIYGGCLRYDLIPIGFAFGLLIALTAFTCQLALLQDARWLAAFGITGGFACPLLLSSGQGSHLVLFSYYALLNAGVFLIALRRTWRMLAVIGFAFTFVVGAAWGYLRYSSEHYLSAQGFLLLFFLFYVGTGFAFARQRHADLRNLVDATLVLGTPLLAFGLQVALVADRPFGIALSAMAVGCFYIVVATALWRRGTERARLLVEAFLAIGVIFGSLAIPFALEHRWTSAAWAVEGAGFVWLGLRGGQRRATWMFGLLLQLGAWAAFIAAVDGMSLDEIQHGNLWLGFFLLASGAFVAAVTLHRNALEAASLRATLAATALASAAVWLLVGFWTEAWVRTDGVPLADWMVVGALVTAGLLQLVAMRLRWRFAQGLALLAQLMGAGVLGIVANAGWVWFDVFERDGTRPLLGPFLIAVAALASARILGRAKESTVERELSIVLLLWAGMWWFFPVLNIVAGRLQVYLPAAAGDGYSRWVAVYALCTALSSLACTRFAARLEWDELRWLGIACWIMLAMVTCDAIQDLYLTRELLAPARWLGWAALWLGAGYLQRRWPAGSWAAGTSVTRCLHALRIGGPWLALWPTGADIVQRWLHADGYRSSGDVLDWSVDGAWSNFLPTWVMMGILAWLMRRSSRQQWPTVPVSEWYRTVLVPAGTTLMLLLVCGWNLYQDGGMAPLPYLPLVNPLDLTTAFALVLAFGAASGLAASGPDREARRRLVRTVGIGAVFFWLNGVVLRSASHYLGLPYRWGDLFASQQVQAILSLAWSACALVLMRQAARKASHVAWLGGAALLGVVVLKLFVVDLADGSSIARVISFVGVGLSMVLIGYVAPYPRAALRGQPPARP